MPQLWQVYGTLLFSNAGAIHMQCGRLMHHSMNCRSAPGSSAATRSLTGTSTGRGGRSCAARPGALSGVCKKYVVAHILEHKAL